MKIAVISFPDSDGSEEIKFLFSNILEQEITEIWHQDSLKASPDLIIVAGMSNIRGEISRTSILENSFIFKDILERQDEKKYIIGIGDGFRLLCEIGLLPGQLLKNKHNHYISKNIFVKADNNNNPFTALVSKHQPLKLPISADYGRYYADDETLNSMRLNDQILFRYCDINGNLSEKFNPVDSIENIAGISNQSKTVFGFVPQPEKAVVKITGNTDGLELFHSILKGLAKS